jgi:uncharacterized protein (TIGR00266 family)
MQTTLNGSPSFAYIHVDLEPGESIIAESDAMSSMAAGIDMKTVLNGGFMVAILRWIFGGESLFVNQFSNPTQTVQRVTLVQATPGDIRGIDLNGDAICLQPGAYVCGTPGLKMGVRFAGLRSWIAREGLFKLEVSGTGKLFYGAYGGLVDKQVDGAYLVDTSHLVAYEPQLKIRLQMAGGLISSFFGGEGLVTRVEGRGRIVLQTRSLSGLAGWLNPKL